jgi:hypothetical protein
MTNCDKPEPDTTNLCHIDIGQTAFRDTEGMPHFCTGPPNDRPIYNDPYIATRERYCGLMSTGGEWGQETAVENGCWTNWCNFHQAYDPSQPCCFKDGICCSTQGVGLQCTRLSFTGDPVQCCINDLNCNDDGSKAPPACYSDSSKQNACSISPNYRDITSTDCQDTMFEYCTGTLPTDDPNSVEWLDRWTEGSPPPCYKSLIRNIFKGDMGCSSPIPVPTPGICGLKPIYEYNAEGYFWGQRLIERAMQRYTEQGFKIGSLPGFPGYNPWQDIFLYPDVCCPYPGLCQSGLDSACSTQTAQRISLNPAVAQWCGCHLPGGEYEEYSVKFNIPAECSPMCNRIGTVPIVGVNAETVRCNQTVCLIDGVTLNLINAQIGGGIDFDQICGNCQGAICSCVASNTTIDISNSTIGGNVVPIRQGCGTFTCTQTNPGITGPNTISVPCGGTGYNPYETYDAAVEAAQKKGQKESWLWTMLAIGVGLVLIFLIIFFLTPPTERTNPIAQTTPISKPVANAMTNPTLQSVSIVNGINKPQGTSSATQSKSIKDVTKLPMTQNQVNVGNIGNTFQTDSGSSQSRFSSIEDRL